MNPEFITAHKQVQSKGAIIEVCVSGKSFYIPVQNFDANDGFEVKLWNVFSEGVNLEGFATNKDICRLYRQSMSSPRIKKGSTKKSKKSAE